MMLLLLDDNPAKRFHRIVIDVGQFTHLLMHMSQHDPFYRHRRSGDRLASCDTGDNPENETAQSAPEIAAATTPVATLQLRAEKRTMPSFMSEKVIELLQHFGSAPARKPSLRQIDAHRAMLARMIDLHDTIAEGFPKIQSRDKSHVGRIAAWANARNSVRRYNELWPWRKKRNPAITAGFPCL